MKTNKITGKQERPGTKRITTLQLIDLVNGAGEVSVVMKIARVENSGTTLKDIKQSVLDSPWREDDAAKAQIESGGNKTIPLQDPVAALRKANELLSRR